MRSPRTTDVLIGSPRATEKKSKGDMLKGAEFGALDEITMSVRITRPDLGGDDEHAVLSGTLVLLPVDHMTNIVRC